MQEPQTAQIICDNIQRWSPPVFKMLPSLFSVMNAEQLNVPSEEGLPSIHQKGTYVWADNGS